MARRKPKQVLYRRKREGRTNYAKRLTMLIARKTRLVVRLTNQRVIAQLIEFTPQGDKIVAGLDSFALKKLGWSYSCKNIPAAYLTGLLFAEKITEKKITELVFDTGLKSPLKKGKIYAFLQGVVESGVNIPYSEGIFPTEERLSGKHISEEMSKKFNEMKGKINKK